jgi:hypothetical protein
MELPAIVLVLLVLAVETRQLGQLAGVWVALVEDTAYAVAYAVAVALSDTSGHLATPGM